MANVSITIEDAVIALVLVVVTVAATSAVAKAVGWIADAYIKDMDRDRDELYKRMDRDRDELIAMIKPSAERSEERHRETRDALQKLDKKIDPILQGGRQEEPGVSKTIRRRG